MAVTRRANRRGFTLIEVLAAMAILMIIVLMLTRVFRDASNAWTTGTRQMEDNINGRAVLDFIARDIATAIAGETNCTFYHRSSNSRWWSDELNFVSLTGNPDGGTRETRQTIYYVTNMTDKSGNYIPNRFSVRRIVRSDMSLMNSYTSAYWWTHSTFNKAANDPVVAENVNLFQVWCAGATNDADGNLSYFHGLFDYNSLGDISLMKSDYIWYTKSGAVPFMKGKLPVRIDLYLELLGEDAAVRVAQLRNANLNTEADRIVSQNVRKYMTRIYFPNRIGYGIDHIP